MPDDIAVVRTIILSCLESPLDALGIAPEAVSEDFDIRAEGVVDSLGFVKLVADLEERLGFPLDFDELDPDRLTVMGPLAKYIATKYAGVGRGLAPDRSH